MKIMLSNVAERDYSMIFLFSSECSSEIIACKYCDLYAHLCDKYFKCEHICDWILEKRSKSHIRSFEINGFKELKPA